MQPLPRENSPVAMVLSAHTNPIIARYAFDDLFIKFPASKYQIMQPDEKLLADDLDKTERQLEVWRSGRDDDFGGH